MSDNKREYRRDHALKGEVPEKPKMKINSKPQKQIMIKKKNKQLFVLSSIFNFKYNHYKSLF